MLKRRILSVLLVLAMLVPFAGAAQTAQDNMRGVWVASVANIDYPSSAGMTAQALAAEADTMLDNIAAMGLNTVFLQVRPSADALYRSALFPQSRYVSGNCGASPDGDFDVLAYWVEGAHERGLQLHAWINPYRITRNGREELDSLPESSPARQHPEWVVEYDGNYYFNPGLPAVQQLVVDGVAEIVRNYDVDGIHLDDYFYPGTDFNDTETFARYGADFNSIDDWRRDNVNTLIASLDETLHTLDPELSFSELYCDSLEWIRRGTVDYICPQLYWAIGYKAADFETLVRWWQKAVSTSDVALYIGLGAYRSAEAQEGDVWYGTAELERQLALLDDSIDIQGEVYFSYASLERVAGCPAMLTAHYKAKDAGHPAPPSTNEPDGCTQQQVTLLNMLSTLIASLFA